MTASNNSYTGYTYTASSPSALSYSNVKDATKTWTMTYTPITYNLSYTLNDGALAYGVSNPSTYNIESSAITLNNPSKLGYTFDGWSGTGLSGTTTTATVPNGSYGDRSFTANWTRNTYIRPARRPPCSARIRSPRP